MSSNVLNKIVVALSLSILGAIPAERINHKAVLKWAYPQGNYSGFNVYRLDCSSGNFVLLKSVGKTNTTTDSAVIGGETYTYKVTTTYKGSESVPTNSIATTVPY